MKGACRIARGGSTEFSANGLVQARVRARASERSVAALVVGAGPAFAVDQTKNAAPKGIGEAFEARAGAQFRAHDVSIGSPNGSRF
jgi:hypothetical protein